MKQTCILILGMHRSGTSALSGVLQKFDVDLGSTLSGSANDNEKGFFENKFFVEYNEKILSKIDIQWDDMYFDYDDKKSLLNSQDIENLQKLIMREFGKSHLFAIKDPRISYLFPLYEKALRNLDIDIKVLLSYRNPLEVAKSLEIRNGFSIEKSILLWLSYTLNAEKYTRRYNRYFLKFSELVDNTELIIKNIDKNLYTDFYNLYNNREEEIQKFLERGLKHHTYKKFYFPIILSELMPTLNQLLSNDFNELNIAFYEDLEKKYFNILKYFLKGSIEDFKKKIILLKKDAKLKDKKIIEFQGDIRKQTKWAKELDEKNKQKDEKIIKLQEDVAKETKKIENLNMKIEGLEKEHARMKYNNNLMFARLKKMESSKVIRFMEKLINFQELPPKEALKKVFYKIIPSMIPMAIHKIKNKKIIHEMKSIKNDKIVVVFPIIAWGFRWQRPQHLLSGLAKKGYIVLYISKDFKYKKTTKKEREDILSLIQMQKLDANIYKLYLNSMKQLNIYKDELDIHNVHWFMLQLSFVLKNFKNKKIIYFVQFPNWLHLVKKIKAHIKGKVVFDCMDEHSGFNNVDKLTIEHEKNLLKTSDLIISSSNKLYNRNVKYNSNVVKIKNGTEFDFFNTRRTDGLSNKYKNKPIVGYYGAIADWFDIEMMEFCAKNRPEYNFIFIGSTFSCDIASIQKLDNVFFLGEKLYSELPKYLHDFDICIIPFKIIPLIEATNPVKFYEYISAGKAVVATRLPELEEFKDICYLANNQEEFLEMLDLAVAEKSFDNYGDLLQRRVEIAKTNSWKTRVEALHKELENING